MLYKKEKKSIWIVVIGLVAVVAVGIVIYFAWPKESKTSNYEEEVQYLQAQLIALKSKFNSLPDSNQRTLLERKMSIIESQVNNLSNQGKRDKSTIKRLENEIKKLEKRLENDKPDEDPEPSEKKEGEFIFIGKGVDSNGNENYMFNEVEDRDKMISVNKDHPRIKELFNQGKLGKVNLNKPEKFTIRFSEKDDYGTRSKYCFFFNEFNTELEIKENDQLNKEKFSFTGDEVVNGYYAFSNLDFSPPEHSRFIVVSKNHSQFKKLLSERKLKVNKQFIISYGVPSRVKSEVEYYFDEDNEKLEIKEI